MTQVILIIIGILMIFIVVGIYRVLAILVAQNELLTRMEETVAKGMSKQVSEFNAEWSKHHLDEVFLKAMKNKEKEERKK